MKQIVASLFLIISLSSCEIFAENSSQQNKIFKIENELYYNYQNDQDAAQRMSIGENNELYIIGWHSKPGLISSWICKKYNNEKIEDLAFFETFSSNIDFIGEPYSMTITENDDLYICGRGMNLVSDESGNDALLMKFDNNGDIDPNFQSVIINGQNGYDTASGVVVDRSGDIYLVGYAENKQTGSSQQDMFINKYNSKGIEITKGWAKTIDILNNRDFIMGAALDNSDKLITFGMTIGDPFSESYCIIQKYEKDGTLINNWNKKFKINNGFPQPMDMKIDVDNNVYIVGSGSNLKHENSGSDIWIQSYDQNGLLRFEYIIDENRDEYGKSIFLKDDLIYIGGDSSFLENNEKNNFIIRAINSKGEIDYPAPDSYFDNNQEFDWLNQISFDNNGNLVVIGSSRNSISENSGDDWHIIHLEKPDV
ncbi:MAG: hypothetical protein JEY91_17815 [Spirochaetaceae bacterium]|nr:hypothetical protein [Spirochaetaceae bacterium]